MVPLLLLFAAAVYVLPDLAAGMGLGTVGAWGVVTQGLGAAVLWLVLAVVVRGIPARAVALWGAFEAAESGACRLAFSMHEAPVIPEGLNACDVATGGWPMTWLSVCVPLLLAAGLQALVDKAAP